MRAIVRERYGTPDVVEMREVDPPVPRDDEVLVAIRATSVNTTDLDFLSGRPPVARLAFGLRTPRTVRMGCDLAGTVAAVGSAVTGFSVGDQVWADLSGSGYGAFAGYGCVREKVLAPMPRTWTFEQAATVPHSAVLALQGLRAKRTIGPGDTVLINGAGGCVGPFAIQLAKQFGAEVTGVDHTAKVDWMRAVGADHTIDYSREDFTKSGRRYDLILDIAARQSVLHYRKSLTAGGSYVLIARSLAGFVQAFLVGGGISLAGRRSMGVFGWTPSNRDDLDFLAGLCDAGSITAHIDRSYDLSGTADALRRHAAGLARGKLVIIP